MKSPRPKCAPFKAGTTRVSNPVCSPCFRASASDAFQRSAFATGVLHDINAFHRYTMHSDLPSRSRAGQFRAHFMGWAHGFHTRHVRPPTRPLRPVNPNNARHLCITAAAGTELAVASSFGNINSWRYYRPVYFSRMTGVYNPKAFILHAASHCQACAHCE